MRAADTAEASLLASEALLDTNHLVEASRAAAEVINVASIIRQDTEAVILEHIVKRIARPDAIVAEHTANQGSWGYDLRAVEIAHHVDNGNHQFRSLSQVVVEAIEATEDGVAVLDPAEDRGAQGLVAVVIEVRLVICDDGCCHGVLNSFCERTERSVPFHSP